MPERGPYPPLDVLRSAAAVLRASARLSFRKRGASLPELVSRLRDAPPSRSADPLLSLAILERLLPLLPPYGTGRCVKRSLLLLDLWSRAGLDPELHLGLSAGEERRGHAWVTTREAGFETYRPADIVETYRA
jgi:hypothetical protein